MPPDNRLRYLALTVVLGGVVLAFLLWVNTGYLFHTQLFENGDPGANSLSVLRAEHFHELYGNYSRWGFHHPGPAVMYSFALGEILFYRIFHLVPTPYNAQVIMLMILVASFFAAGVCVAARWVRGVVFVPLALLLAALHFTAMDPLTWALLAWMPFVMTLLFFSMLIASASVGAGQGDDLPLLALSCGFMLHTHVAQPLFVGPLFLLAYAGLAWACLRAPVRAWPWRAYPRAHAFAAVLLAAFALPLVVDLFFGTGSNVALILEHVRTHQGERHPWPDAVYCFLRFGGYDASHNFNAHSPTNVTPAQIGLFVARHFKMEFLWLAALLVPLVAFVVRRRGSRAAPDAVPGAETPVLPPVPAPAGRWRFLGFLTFFWLVAVGLTVFWDRIQDGDMFYYNSWFTYSIYYVLALLGAGGVSDLVENWAARRRHPGLWTALAAVLCLLAVGGWISQRLGPYHAVPYDDAASRAQARTVDATLAARQNAPRTKLLVFPHDGWGAAVGIADLLVRQGYPCVVPPSWRFMFGDDLAPADLFSRRLVGGTADAAMDIWHVVPAATDRALAVRSPLIDGYALLPGGAEIDPANGAAITFVGPQANSDSYVLTGWSTPDASATYVWSEEKQAIIHFAPKPVPAGAVVEVAFSCLDVFRHAGKRDAQRITLHFNGADLGTFRVDPQTLGSVKAAIPAAVWNQRPSAILACGFPDAISPMECGENLDTRPLGLAMDKITFRVIDAPNAPAAP